MRIAYICADPGIPVFGQKGCSIHVQEVIRALRRQGAQVDLFAVRCDDPPPEDLTDLNVHRLPPIPNLERAVRERVALSSNDDLQRELEHAGPFDLIYERYSLWSYSAMELAQKTNIPGILEVNAPLIEEQAKYRGLVHRDEAEQVARRAFQSAGKLIAVSQGVKHYLTNWVEADKVQVIPNGVNDHRFSKDVQPSLPKDPDTFTVGFVGSLKPWHGLSHLVGAFSQLHQHVPQSRLLIVGDGPQRKDMEAELTRRGLQSVVSFTGAVSPAAIPGLLASMDAAVAPYPEADFYFSPLKVVEYMAAGLPVVVSRIGQLADLVENNVTGLLCPPGNEAALANALERLWLSPSLRECLGLMAKRHILMHHTWDGVARQIIAIAHNQYQLTNYVVT
ncbi:glycosyltransferase family 4 protein [Leptolyngbya cf. ectocarpi LEGE 11479]|uniref:Glycosyltransferase family 4 protein n=1 Tax=Leptolyngbya cf. ectocarpi LEGE 11479 TaxID=1828722 RepID=A0A928ZWK7_LEPEC|nr:glycosyltransferase family 4 protein [Leptolyngbya ectocarpi]MBE9068785.1 glycosyltransferase family 4 protein [Leptolyngbya cf. ectocarpi LEGE 11479]